MEERTLTLFDDARRDLSPLLEAARAEPRLALDTESDPFHRYFEKVCLIQISTAREDFVVDPLAIGLPGELRALLADPARTFVIHGADYDVRSLVRSFELALPRVFDTSIAASLLGLKTLGLKALLETQLQINIEKKEQRSDWGKRPLTAVQLEYARQDTRYLLPLAEKLEGELALRGRHAWLEEECAQLVARCSIPGPQKTFDPESWRKLKGARELDPNGRRALRAMFLFREAEAQRIDQPPFRIMRNESMVELAKLIAKRGLPGACALGKSKLVPRRIDRAALHKAISGALAESDTTATENPTGAQSREPLGREVPTAPARGHTPLDAGSKQRLQRLRSARALWAERLGLDPGFLIAGSILERLARDPPRTLSDLSSVRGLTSWRLEAIGPEILAVIAH